MTLQISMQGTRYNDGEPLWLTTMNGDLLFNRVTESWVTWASMNARATAEGWGWANREIGIPSLTWRLTHLGMNYQWGPGLDSTSGLASEAVTNGEEWTGADIEAGTTTPPTGWTLIGDSTCQNFSGTINLYADPVTGGGMSQTISGTPGEWYVLEMRVEVDTTADAAITLDGVGPLPIGPGNPDGSNRIVALSFEMPADGDVDLDILLAGGGIASIGFIRVYLESELTGSGASAGIVTPTLPPTKVNGPYQCGETTYFIQSFPATGDPCLVWFDVDADPDPDIKLTLQQVCESNVSDEVKLQIDADLKADEYCSGLPCMTVSGRLKVAYSRPESQE